MGLFRCSGDILFDDNQPLPGQISNVQLKKYSETSNFLQYMLPLTPRHPYFFAQIRSLAQNSKITIGIAGADIDSDAHPGHWNGTVGYHSDTGHCFTSHFGEANTEGERFSIGDMFGVMVTYFGEEMSTVVFLKNSIPVATRYMFEADKNKFLPTLYLQYGPIDLGIMWPQAAISIPQFDEHNMRNWIKGVGVEYDIENDMFTYDRVLPQAAIQCPVPLCREMVHYEVIIQEAECGESPAVGIATCSPIYPTPTCILLRDFFRWKADGTEFSAQEGQRIGFGIHYDPEVVDKPDFNEKQQQLVLCFVTIDSNIVFFRMMLQPQGGFYPLILLSPNASRVSLDVETNRDLGDDSTKELLDKLFKDKLHVALQVMKEDIETTGLSQDVFRKSSDILVDIRDIACLVKLPKKVKKIHGVQLLKPLTQENAYFSVQILKMNEESSVSVGIAGCTFSLTPQVQHVGKASASVGYLSKDGKVFPHNTDSFGDRFFEGDMVGVQIISFVEGYYVVLFMKNDRPIEISYFNCDDPEQLFPTLTLCGNGYPVEVCVYWPNRVGAAPERFAGNLNRWMLPAESKVDVWESLVILKPHSQEVYLLCPCRLHDSFNHFEITLIDDINDSVPMVAISGAGRGPNNLASNFRPESLVFNPLLASDVVKGQNLGWGLLIPDSEIDKEERMVICYLTRDGLIEVLRVIFEPPGGLFPMVKMPAGSNRVQFDFSRVNITSHPITTEMQEMLLKDAKEIYNEEREFVKAGHHPDDFKVENSKLIRTYAEVKSIAEGVDHTAGMDATGKKLGNKKVKSSKPSGSKACVLL